VTDLAADAGGDRRAAPFNILVNNAGTNRPKPLLDVTVDDFDAIMGSTCAPPTSWPRPSRAG
jgi:NAD(P)-dependent dehydrogenase (short-subunit alcohol dehydrogenase family)